MAAMKETVPAITKGDPKTSLRRFITPKSTIAPIAPTNAKRKNRPLSLGFVNIAVMPGVISV